ncbi:hypothetical protein CO612_09015 [Lysobacteraceae bacterium NML71-0210]|nr:hypothetical protein CO612_09015 [Xanthomonadaceae bacterium NML71-0210]
MILVLAATVLYLSAALMLAASLRQPEKENNRSWLPLAILAMVFHGEMHVEAWRQVQAPELHFFATLSLATLGMSALATGLALSGRMSSLGLIVFPLAAMSNLLYRLGGHAPPVALGWQLQLHAWIALSAYAVLAVAALLAILLWMQERTLRKRGTHRWPRILPPLTELERLMFHGIWLGFFLLSATLLTGALFVHDLLSQQLAHKTVLSLLSWVIFGILLFGRWRYGWRGIKAARLTLIAMLLLALSFFGSQFVYEFVLRRG